MQELRINEVGNKYNNWSVINYAGAKRGKATWTVRCLICNQTAIILGRELRKGVRPRHKCNKVCRKCGASEPSVVFTNDKYNLGNICVGCHKQYIGDWRLNNRHNRSSYITRWNDQHQANVKRYRKQQRDHIQSSHTTFIKQSWESKLRNLRQYTITDTKRASRLHRRPESYRIGVDLQYLLDLWDKQGGKCAVSRMSMTHQFYNPRSVSIDRIDSEIGYIDGNIQLVCQWVNLAKSSHSNDLIKHVLSEFKNGT